MWTMPSFKTLYFTFYIGSTPTFSYFDLYLNNAFARNVRLYVLYRQYTNLFIFRFVSEHCLGSKRYILLSISIVHQPFYILICIWTLPTLETLVFTIHIGSTPTFLYFDLYLNTAFARNVRLYFLYRQYTNLFIFWFVPEHCLRSKR